MKKKDVFDVAVDVSFDEAIKGTPLNLKFGSLRVLYTANRIVSIFKLDSINKVRMRVRGSGMVGGQAKSVICCFSGIIFFSNCIQGRLRIKKK